MAPTEIQAWIREVGGVGLLPTDFKRVTGKRGLLTVFVEHPDWRNDGWVYLSGVFCYNPAVLEIAY